MAAVKSSLHVAGSAKLWAITYLVVPVNQRSYKWERDHVNDLLQDLQNAITDNPEKDYFLGTIVLTKGEKGTLEVADG